MIPAAALVIGAIALGWLAPAPLRRLARNPALGLTWWLALASGVVVSTLVGAILLLLAGRHSHLWEPCPGFLGHPHVHPFDEVAGALLLVLLCLAAARAGRSVRRRIRWQRKAYRAHLAVLSEADGVLWLDHDAPFVYSIGGRPGLIVASTGLERLPRAHREALLRHERQHLRGRHHLIVMAAEAAGDALPRVPLLRGIAVAARRLTELAADAHAARECGTEAVRGALRAMGETRRAQALRPWRAARSSRLAVGLTSTLAPPALGGLLLGALTALAC